MISVEDNRGKTTMVVMGRASLGAAGYPPDGATAAKGRCVLHLRCLREREREMGKKIHKF